VTQYKRLTLLRHAKSSWAGPNVVDHDRRLNARGQRAAAAVGRYIQHEGIAPDLVLCSSARRTNETLRLLDLAATIAVLVEDELYGASAGELIERLRCIDDSAQSVLVVGHNPGIQDLAINLTGDQGSLASFPTAALALLSLPIAAWHNLRAGAAILNAFVVPRTLY
jgi:phosphohistidine phosphatase